MSEGDSIERLFVAVPLPAPVSERLVRMQPPSQAGVRRIARNDMHITLHFLGRAKTAPVSQSLRSVEARQFSVRLAGRGSFSLRGPRTILWVGVEPVAGLIALHEKTAKALSAVGLKLEGRPYRPHITVARLAARAPRDLIESFKGLSQPEDDIDFECSRYALFASETAPKGARYRELGSFPLNAGS